MSMEVAMRLILATILMGSLAAAFAQNSPSQPVDPTGQAPSSHAPSTPTTFPPGIKRTEDTGRDSDSAAKSSDQESERTFVGTIVRKWHHYVLKAADAEYLLEDRGEAKKYKGKMVKVTGRADENHVINVKTIELSSGK